MIDLYTCANDTLIGSITDADLKVLTDALEEESTVDQDYYIDRATIDVIGDGRASEHLMGLLRTALGTRDWNFGAGIRWPLRARAPTHRRPRRQDRRTARSRGVGLDPPRAGFAPAGEPPGFRVVFAINLPS